jgi:hypothetical protein
LAKLIALRIVFSEVSTCAGSDSRPLICGKRPGSRSTCLGAALETRSRNVSAESQNEDQKAAC